MYAKLVAFLLLVAIIACIGIGYADAEPGYRRYGGYGHGHGGGHRGYGHGHGHGGGYGHRGYGYHG